MTTLRQNIALSIEQSTSDAMSKNGYYDRTTKFGSVTGVANDPKQ